MGLVERIYGVWLGTTRTGLIHQRGDYTRFVLDEAYRQDPDRPVLGLQFEQDLSRAHAAALRLPPWFSNLLPEGLLRAFIAEDRGVSADREMELLAQVGHDLPGAVRVLPSDEIPPADIGGEVAGPLLADRPPPGWRFSLAGVQLKFSMLAVNDRLTLPAYGEGGDWIVKLPDRQYPDVPRNEYAVMSLAAEAGIEVPELRLVHRDQLSGLPDQVWPGGEGWAYAVRRFDRSDSSSRRPIHIEDLAQVCNVYPEQKYSGNYETVASLIYRRHDWEALVQFARRLAFMVVVGNGDGHLKNWSLIYHDPRRPTLAPAYDLVATSPYRVNGAAEDLGLKFGGSRRFDRASLGLFDRLEAKLGSSVDLAGHAADTARRALSAWPRFEEVLRHNPRLRREITEGIRARAAALLSGASRSL